MLDLGGRMLSRCIRFSPVLSLAAFILCTSHASAQPPEVPIRLELAVPDSAVAPKPKAELAVRVVLQREGSEDVRRLEAAAPGMLELTLPAESHWQLSIEAEDYWAPTRAIRIDPVAEGSEPEPIPIELLPAGWISVGLRTQASGLPDRLTLRISPATEDGPEAEERWSETCEVQEGAARCRVPAGAHHLRLGAEGFVPHYFWDLDLPFRDVRRLGTLELRPGASLVGWIEPPTPRFTFEQVEVELVPRTAAVLDSRSLRRSTELRRSVTVDERGFFQFSGVPAGEYRLLVDHPDYVQTRLDLALEEGEESELDPLELSEGAILDLRLRYRTDPFLKPWRISLFYSGVQEGYAEEERSDVLALEDGTLRLSGLPPGEYRLEVEDSRDGRWHAERLELFEGVNDHEVLIRFERLEVTLLLGDEPLEGARVEIQEHLGNFRQAFTSREGGKVYAFLRADRKWNFEIDHEERGVAASFREVAVPEVVKGDRHPKKDLVIPATRIFGRIVDVHGEPFAGRASLDLSAEGVMTFQRFVEGSEFDFEGLPAGPLAIQATRYGDRGRTFSQSPRLSVVLEEGFDQGPIVLRMQPTRTLSGLVVSPEGEGVAGAQVVALLETEGSGSLTAGAPAESTDLEGVFTFDLPAAADAVQLTVYPPGYTATQQRIRRQSWDGVPVIVPVESTGGTVVIRYENPPEAWLEEGWRMTFSTFLFTPNAHIPLYLMRWASPEGDVLPNGFQWTIPNIAPGEVQVCFGRWIRSLLGSGLPIPESEKDRCVEGTLPPRGELTLTISEEIMEREASAESSRSAN